MTRGGKIGCLEMLDHDLDRVELYDPAPCALRSKHSRQIAPPPFDLLCAL